jgi:hypothetical protein
MPLHLQRLVGQEFMSNRSKGRLRGYGATGFLCSIPLDRGHSATSRKLLIGIAWAVPPPVNCGTPNETLMFASANVPPGI